MKKGGDDGWSPELKKLRPKLARYAMECLRPNCRADKPRLQYTAAGYVKRAVEAYVKEGDSLTGEALRDRLQDMICDAVRADEQRTLELIKQVDWEKAVFVAVAAAVKKYGTSRILDKDITDYVQEAVQQLLERSRRFPHDGEVPVTMTTWLAQTVRSRISHDLRKANREPRPLRIVTDRPAEQALGEVSEEQLPATEGDDAGEDDDDADHRRPRLANLDLLSGPHRYGHGPAAYAHPALG